MYLLVQHLVESVKDQRKSSREHKENQELGMNDPEEIEIFFYFLLDCHITC